MLDLALPRAIAWFASTRSQAAEWLAVPRGRRTGSLSTTATRTHHVQGHDLIYLIFWSKTGQDYWFQRFSE